MRLELKKLFSGEIVSIPFSFQMDLSGVELSGVCPFASPVEVKGEATSRAGSVQLKAKAEFDLSVSCDRCMDEIQRHESYSFSHLLVTSLENEEDEEEYIRVEGESLDLDELFRGDVLLEIPMKFLCREDCKGLCPSCGQNLNHGSCGCNLHQVDPRLEVLRQLID